MIDEDVGVDDDMEEGEAEEVEEDAGPTSSAVEQQQIEKEEK